MMNRLETEDLVLGKAWFEDWESLYHTVWSQPETARYTHDTYLVYEKKSGRAIGFAGVEALSPYIFKDAGIALGPAYTGQGYGRQILKRLMAYCKDDLGGKEFYYATRAGNTASKALAISCGFTCRYSVDRTDPRDGAPYVLEVYSRLLTERETAGNPAYDAAGYDERIRRTLPYYDDFYRQVTALLKASGRRGLSWLDLGCGTGRMYEAAQRELSLESFDFTDRSEEMLQIAECRYKAPGNRFRKMAVCELSEKDRYDVITAIQVNHYLSEKERREAVQRCYDALKPGGFFFTFENFAPNSEAGKKLLLQRWQEEQVRLGKSEAGAREHIRRYGAAYFPISLEEHLTLMRSCGFEATELIWLSNLQAGWMGIKKTV